MNFFYEEPRKKQLHYFKNSKKSDIAIFPSQTKNNIEEANSLKPQKLFRFSFLVIDLGFLNVILIVLLNLLNLDKATNQSLILTSNFSWISSAYLTALYFGKEKFLLRTIQSYLLYTGLTLFLNFLFKTDYYRPFVLLVFGGFGVSLIVSRVIFIGAYSYLKNNVVSNSYIVLGYNELSFKLVSSLDKQSKILKFKGFFDDSSISSHSFKQSVIGSLSDSLDFAIKNEISEIYSTIPPENNPEIYEIALAAEKNFIRFRFVPDFSIFINRRVHISFVSDLPILSLRQEPLEDLGSQFKKRIFDVVFSSFVILFILSWLVPIIGILIKLDSKGPVFFKQLRSGKNNMPFLCFKFRSLHVNKDSDTKQVSRNDNRYTRIGKFLRKTNLDEFPQFFNVFQGYMSVVGPRPHMLKHTEQYSKVINQYMIRHYVKPGLTGLAQVNGYRGEITKEEDLTKRIECDIKYMESWSMLFDIQIIFQTIYLSIKGDKNAF